MNNKLIASLMGIVVCVTLSASLLVPVLNGATQTSETFENEGIFYIVSDSKTHNITLNDGVWAVDGVNLDFTNRAYTVLATESFLLRDVGQFRGSIAASAITALDLTISDGSITGSYTNTSGTIPFDSAYESYILACSVETGHVMTAYGNNGIYVNGDSSLYANGLIGSGNVYVRALIKGSLNDGFEISLLNAYGSGEVDSTISNIEVTSSSVDGFLDLYKLASISFDWTYAGVTDHATFTAIVAPETVTAEYEQHLSTGQISLIKTIPIFVILAIMVVLAIPIITKKDY